MPGGGFPLTALLLVVSYLLGCFSTGYYLARLRTGQDLRATGSGSTGSSNAGRLLGARGFVLTLIGDVGKGALAVALGAFAGLALWLQAALLLAAVTGHLFPIQLGLRGGKGLATGFGALLVLDYRVALSLLVLVGLSVILTRQKTFSAVGGVLLAPLLALLWGHPPGVGVMLALVALLVTHANRANIRAALARLR